MTTSVGHAPKTFSAVGAGGLAEALREAVDDGVIARETADQIIQSHEELTAGTPPSADGEVEVKVVTSEGHAPKTFSVVGAGSLAEALREAVDDGVIAQETADQIIQSFEELRAGTPQLSNGEEVGKEVKISVWHAPVAFSAVVGAASLVEALQRAVDDGVIDQEGADRILRSLEAENAGSLRVAGALWSFLRIFYR